LASGAFSAPLPEGAWHGGKRDTAAECHGDGAGMALCRPVGQRGRKVSPWSIKCLWDVCLVTASAGIRMNKARNSTVNYGKQRWRGDSRDARGSNNGI